MREGSSTVGAARGYLELGLAREASEELDSLPTGVMAIPEIVFLRAEIYIHLHKWPEAMMLARPMAGKFPDEPAWWLFWAFSLKQLGDPDEAFQVMSEAAELHPDNPSVLYTLARCSSATGDLSQAKLHLARAFDLEPKLRDLASDDADLAPFRTLLGGF